MPQTEVYGTTGVGRPAWRVPLGVAALLAVASAFVAPAVAQWLVVAGGVVGVDAVTRATRRARRASRRRIAGRHPLALLAVGMWIGVLAEALHASGAPYPSYADAVGLAAYPFVLVGLLRLVTSRLRERPLDTLLVAAIVPAAAGAFGWMPLIASLSGDGSGHAGITAAFLVVDALATAMVARLTLRFRGRPVAYQLLLGSFGALLGAHVSREAAAVTGVVPAPFGSQTLLLLSFGLLAAAVAHPSLLLADPARPRAYGIGRSQVVLLAAAVLAGPAVLLSRGDRHWLVAGGPALVSLLVVAHLARLAREHGRLEHESTHDSLTGLPNRPEFHDAVAAAIAEIGDGGRFAIGYLDLDRFKKVNDSFGHDAGDDLLRRVSRRLESALRREDVVARLAGDEFAVLLGDSDAAEARATAERILARFAAPFSIGGRDLFMTPSIGLAFYPDHGTDPDLLLRHADAAMYEAKRRGQGVIETYDGRLGTYAHQQLAIETRLQIGIGNDELVVHYQPKISLRTGRVTGVEALVRWEHPTLGLVPPGAFMPLAEETGLVALVGEQVLRNACRQVQQWRTSGFPDLTVSVNVSLREFNAHDLVDVVAAALAESGLPAAALELELTESADLTEAQSVAATLARLRLIGVRCSIDDFGTGYSGIAYLNDLPIDKIKLDKSFIDRIDAEGGDAPLVRAMIAMAHSLDLEVVAEGVETPQQVAFLRAQGCDTIQGFFYSRPLPADAVAGYLDSGTNVVPFPVPVAAVRDEQQLGAMLWAEAQAEVSSPGAQVDSDGIPVVRRTLVLSSVASVMAVPTLLGLTAASALPPAAQHIVAAGFETIGATPPRPTAPAVDSGKPSRRAPVLAVPPAATQPRPAVGVGSGRTPSRGQPTVDTPPAKTSPSKSATPGKSAGTGSKPASPNATPPVTPPGKPAATPSHPAHPTASPSPTPRKTTPPKPTPTPHH